ARFADLPAAAADKKRYAGWSGDFQTWVYAATTLELKRSPGLGELSRAGESERDFRLRLAQAGREARDAQVEALRAKYGPRIATLDERLRRAQQAVERESQQ